MSKRSLFSGAVLVCMCAAMLAPAVADPAAARKNVQVQGRILSRKGSECAPALLRFFEVYNGTRLVTTFKTDDKGEFAFALVPSSLAASGEQPWTVVVRPINRHRVADGLLLGTRELKIAAGSEVPEQEWIFDNAQEVVVTGSVCDETGAPLAEMPVTVRFQEPGLSYFHKVSARAGDEGDFSLRVPLLASQDYVVEAHQRDDKGWWHAERTLTSEALAQPLHLTCQRFIGNVIVRFVLQGAADKPVGLDQKRFELASHPECGGQAVETASLSFYNVPYGRHEIRIHPTSPSWKEYVFVEGTNTFELTDQDPLPKQITVLLRPRRRGMLKGCVLERGSQKPVPGIPVRALGLDARKAQTDAEGRFGWADMLEGRYVLLIESSDFAPLRTEVDIPTEADVVIELARYGVYSGTVVNPAGQPVVGALLEMKPQGGLKAPGPRTDGRGKFEASVPPGTYLVDIFLPIEPTEKGKASGIVRVKRFLFKMTDRDIVENYTVPGIIRWQGRLTLPAGHSKRYETIILYPRKPDGLWFATRLDEGGHFDFWVVPGEYDFGLCSGRDLWKLRHPVTLSADRQEDLQITQSDLDGAETGRLDEKGNFVFGKP